MLQFPYKLYRKDAPTHNNVNFQLYGANNGLIKDYKKQACFSNITYHTIPKNVRKIIVYHSLNEIPYTPEIISKWIAEINEHGFSCEVSFPDKTAVFTIDLSKYVYKLHLNCTLQLVRACYEVGACHVPEIYFGLIDNNNNNNKIDKFSLLQIAHKSLRDYEESFYVNTNHIISGDFRDKNKNVDKETLFGRIKEHGMKVYDDCSNSYIYGKLSALWKP